MSKMELVFWTVICTMILFIIVVGTIYIDWKLDVLIEAFEGFINRCECPTK